MNSFKRVVAITLCFCFVVFSSSSFQVDARVDKGYVRSVKSYVKSYVKSHIKGRPFVNQTRYFKKDWTRRINPKNGLIDINFNYVGIFIYLTNSTKETNRAYKKLLKKWALYLYIYEKTTQSISIKKISKNTFRVIAIDDSGSCKVVVIKKDTNKHRVFEYMGSYSSKKHMKRKIKKQLKFINKLNSL